MMHKFELFGVGKIGPKGQVVIPAEAREELGFQSGDKVMVAGLPHEKAVIVMSEETFNGHMRHMQNHYQAMGDMIKKQAQLTKKTIND